jgi:hypothetical protein
LEQSAMLDAPWRADLGGEAGNRLGFVHCELLPDRCVTSTGVVFVWFDRL